MAVVCVSPLKQDKDTTKEPLMIRRTVTTLTIAAVSAIALASASPAMAASPSGGAEVPTESIGGGTCTLDTVFGSIPCPDFDWSLGGLSSSEAESDESIAVGGVVSDAPLEVVAPGDILFDALTPRLDVFPIPTLGADEDDGTASTDDELHEVVRVLPEDLGLVGVSPAPASSEPVTPTEEASPPVDNAIEIAEPTSDDGVEVTEPAATPTIAVPQTTTTITTITVTVAEPTTTAVANTAVTSNELTEAQALPLGADATDDIDPMAAMIGGILGTLMVVGLGFGAYRFGQRGQ
jgi:hypothetical protein